MAFIMVNSPCFVVDKVIEQRVILLVFILKEVIKLASIILVINIHHKLAIKLLAIAKPVLNFICHFH